LKGSIGLALDEFILAATCIFHKLRRMRVTA
jgi:hypothetical protein